MNAIKVDRLETHDRLLDFREKNIASIAGQIDSLIDQNPFCGEPFYIFAHKRTLDEGERILHLQSRQYAIENNPTHKIVWQPRLQKPKAQTNSMLFKVYPKDPNKNHIVWILPERELWNCYQKGKMFQEDAVATSIYAFEHEREVLEQPEEDDPSDSKAKAIYRRLYPKIWKRLFPNVE